MTEREKYLEHEVRKLEFQRDDLLDALGKAQNKYHELFLENRKLSDYIKDLEWLRDEERKMYR